MDLYQVCVALGFLFYEPNDMDPLNIKAGEVMANDKFKFKRMV